MKKQILFLTVIFIIIFISCKKQTSILNEPVKNKELTLKELIDTIVGNYTTTRICSGGSMISGYTHDTAYNISLEVVKESDSTISIHNKILILQGNPNDKYHVFHDNIYNNYRLEIDSTLSMIVYGHHSGGLGGGSGCNYKGGR